MSEEVFRNNLKTGVWLEWYENGNKKIQTIYRNGLMNGKEINWSVEGNKTSEYSYQGGKKKGSFKTWYDNGRKNLQVVLSMIVRMERLLSGTKMGRNIESKIIALGKKMV